MKSLSFRIESNTKYMLLETSKKCLMLFYFICFYRQNWQSATGTWTDYTVFQMIDRYLSLFIQIIFRKYLFMIIFTPPSLFI